MKPTSDRFSRNSMPGTVDIQSKRTPRRVLRSGKASVRFRIFSFKRLSEEHEQEPDVTVKVLIVTAPVKEVVEDELRVVNAPVDADEEPIGVESIPTADSFPLASRAIIEVDAEFTMVIKFAD